MEDRTWGVRGKGSQDRAPGTSASDQGPAKETEEGEKPERKAEINRIKPGQGLRPACQSSQLLPHPHPHPTVHIGSLLELSSCLGHLFPLHPLPATPSPRHRPPSSRSPRTSQFFHAAFPCSSGPELPPPPPLPPVISQALSWHFPPLHCEPRRAALCLSTLVTTGGQ